MAISVTWNITFTNGMTVTHTNLEQLKTDVENATVTIAADSITNAMLAVPHSYFTITIPCIKDADSLSSAVLATAQPGLGEGYTDSGTSARFAFEVEKNCTLIGFTAGCHNAVSAGTTRDNDAVLRLNAALVEATRTNFPDSGGQKTTGSLSQALLTTDTISVSCETDSAGTDGVVGAYVILHLRGAHVADS